MQPTDVDRLRKSPGVEARVAPDVVNSETARTHPLGMIADVDAMLCTFLPLNHTDMPRLRFVQITSAGFSQLVGQGLRERGIRACNGLGIFDAPIAEWNIAMMVNLARNVRGMFRNQEAGIWDRSAEFQGEVRGRTVGFWGYGGIGRATARLAKGMGMHVHVLTRDGVKPRMNIYGVADAGDPEGLLPDRAFRMNEKEEFLRGVDFLILAMPLTKANEAIVGVAELRLLKSTAFVLNPARGPLIQEAALLQALSEGWIAGAALDTHYHYPMPTDHALWRFPNVILTPHVAGASGGPYYRERLGDLFIQNTERFLSNRPLLNELSAVQLDG